MIVNNDVIEVENAKLRYMNFRGAPDKFNSKGGRRTAQWVIDDEALAKDLIDSGFSVSVKEFEDGNVQYKVKINLAYSEKSNPMIYLVTGKSKTLLTEEVVGQIDFMDIVNVDLILRAWDYGERMGTKSGEPHMSFYIKKAYFTQEVDSFSRKYDFADEEEILPFD